MSAAVVGGTEVTPVDQSGGSIVRGTGTDTLEQPGVIAPMDGEPEQAVIEPRDGVEPLDLIDWSRYDFLDYGCSVGGSLRYCQKRFNASRGVGIDLDPAKVARARDAGHDVVMGDVAQLRGEKQVRFVSMLDFLEHLPSLAVVEAALRNAAMLATDFLFIRHPSFEGEDYLTSLGLGQYWWHWVGHTAHVQVADYCTMFDQMGLRQYLIRYHGPIHDSSHPSILSVDEVIDQHSFDPGLHRSKPELRFERPIWRLQEIFVALRAFEPAEWTEITGRP